MLLHTNVKTKNYNLVLVTSDNKFVIGKKSSGGWDITGDCLQSIVGKSKVNADTVFGLKSALRSLYKLLK